MSDMEKIIIKNFGALQNIDIEIKELTIFIGESGTGKSVLAKLISIFRTFDTWIEDDDNFIDKLSYYQLDSFLKQDTYIEYNHDKIGEFIFDNKENEPKKVKIEFSDKLNEKDLDIKLDEKDLDIKVGKNDDDDFINKIKINWQDVIYIPAERGIVSHLSPKYAALEKKGAIDLLPRTLRDYTAIFNEASFNINKLDIDLFNVTYEKKDDKDYIILPEPEGKKILLSDSASGFQTVIPPIIIFNYFNTIKKSKSYTFEEPELNIFPTTQKLLVEFLAENVLNKGDKIIITTHSPYILTSINNLIQAGNTPIEKKNISKKQVSEIIPEEKWIDFESISVYTMPDGKSIMDVENRLIDAEPIDKVSDLLNEEFDALLDLE